MADDGRERFCALDEPRGTGRVRRGVRDVVVPFAVTGHVAWLLSFLRITTSSAVADYPWGKWPGEAYIGPPPACNSKSWVQVLLASLLPWRRQCSPPRHGTSSGLHLRAGGRTKSRNGPLTADASRHSALIAHRLRHVAGRDCSTCRTFLSEALYHTRSLFTLGEKNLDQGCPRKTLN